MLRIKLSNTEGLIAGKTHLLYPSLGEIPVVSLLGETEVVVLSGEMPVTPGEIVVPVSAVKLAWPHCYMSATQYANCGSQLATSNLVFNDSA